MAKTIKEERMRWVMPVINKEIKLVDIAKVCPYGGKGVRGKGEEKVSGPFFKIRFKILLPRSVQKPDLSNLVRAFELLLKWDRDAGRSV